MTETEICEAKAEYARLWREKNPEKHQAIQERYKRAEENKALLQIQKSCRPCRCGSKHVVISRTGRKLYTVRCLMCGYSLPPTNDAALAVELWNRQTGTSKQTTEAAAYGSLPNSGQTSGQNEWPGGQ